MCKTPFRIGKTPSGRENNFSCVDERLAGSVCLGGQRMATRCSYLFVKSVPKTTVLSILAGNLQNSRAS